MLSLNSLPSLMVVEHPFERRTKREGKFRRFEGMIWLGLRRPQKELPPQFQIFSRLGAHIFSVASFASRVELFEASISHLYDVRNRQICNLL
jgi:hypothetical protein